ncbi:MAG: bifunctional phosphopantothenoylcysteine decarboxylase/phosphopantothenate--cysteine ligase CoaBC [Neisseriaceae bacterium]|nr:bifunctional phosphopantothenoylcysteine decarboxylase/phosphopantothenate--cysteine ligase CoaBC [Neisseriaceae bacterium]
MNNSKHILLGVTGGIAAYKSCEVVRLLKKAGHRVRVVMTPAACEFVSPLTFQALSGEPGLTDLGQNDNAMAHIQAVRQADLLLLAPATANTIAKIACGIADNLLTTMVAARGCCPLVLAPAMNSQMWDNPANIRNINQLQQDGVIILLPNSGDLACGENGFGRMKEPAELVDLIEDIWAEKHLAGKKVLITVGASFEAIDPVRGITNISSGKMGAALAKACRSAGASVSVVAGQMQVGLPAGLTKITQATSAENMYQAVMQHIENQDIFISAAAVADYKVKNKSKQKIKKNNQLPIIELEENPDILASVANLKNPPFCVGFAAESDNVIDYARKKMNKKNLPMIVANAVADAMGKDTTTISIIDKEQTTEVPHTDKYTAANEIVKRMAALLSSFRLPE